MGLGASTIALFGRVGGGIFTKAADIGSDYVSKLEVGLPEDSPQNPGTIADCVGDNVGDVAGMGADIFGSIMESATVAMFLAAESKELYKDINAIVLPFAILTVLHIRYIFIFYFCFNETCTVLCKFVNVFQITNHTNIKKRKQKKIKNGTYKL